MKNISQYIDHTLLKATAIEKDIEQLCSEAIQYNFYAVCVSGSHAKFVKKKLRNTMVKLAVVVGFPLGSSTTEAKVFEAKQAIKNGADEIDMVMNVGLLKDKKYDQVEKEITLIKQAIGKKVLKVILETCYLTQNEIILAAKIAVKAKADFIKTSTGFGTEGATIENVSLMKKTVKNTIKIKASGGIKSKKDLLAYIEIGADRIGTSSGVDLLKS